MAISLRASGILFSYRDADTGEKTGGSLYEDLNEVIMTIRNKDTRRATKAKTKATR